MCGPQPLPQWIQPGFRPPTHLNGEYHHHHHHHYQQQHQHPRWDHDPYNGLMTTKERQWLYNIQQLQLSTDKPYIDDYYYTVFVSRRGDPTGGSFVTEHRERRDSVRDKPYTPMQFQNSLGKLQAGSVTSPRKLLDLEVVSNEGLDCPTTAPPKDTQRCKQMLLEIEKVMWVGVRKRSVGKSRQCLSRCEVGSERILDNIALSTFDNLFARLGTSGATGFGSHEICARNHHVIYLPLLPSHVQWEKRELPIGTDTDSKEGGRRGLWKCGEETQGLNIELYLLLLKLEDSVSPHLEAREIVTETKQELLTNIFTSLLHKDWLVAIMSYRKGKVSTIMNYVGKGRKGKVSTIMSYRKGKVSTIMSYRKGKVSTIMSYRKGKVSTIMSYRKGKVSTIMSYRKGKVSTIMSYRKGKVSTIMSYRKGKVSTIMSYRKGKVSTIMSYRKGKVSTIMSYRKGKVSTIMSYRKGKMLILRLLPHLAQPEVDHQLCGVWVRILGGLPAVSRRDGPLLTHLYPHYKQWLERATPVRVLQLCSSLVSDQGPMRSSRLFLVVGNKFGISALKAILERMQVMYPSLEPHLREEWSSFLSALMAAIQLAASMRSLSPPIEVMDAGVLSRHLQDWSEDSSNMCALFERAFASQPIIK
uniref:Uncharacterized protein n=1 Tax=Timema cristinae TaxID=61476 RepID=A0A7R9DAY9_TIMCR|nr:unnamed protein product [Timema cristinae]